MKKMLPLHRTLFDAVTADDAEMAMVCVGRLEDIYHYDVVHAAEIAALRGNLPIVSAFLDAGMAVDTELSRVYGTTLLCRAADSGNVELVRHLLARGANVHFDDRQMGPLAHAAQSGHADVVAVLLEAGADPVVEGRHNASAAARARRSGHEAIALTLEAAVQVRAPAASASPAC